MNRIKSALLILPVLCLAFGSVGHATWLHRAIEGGKPRKIDLVALYLLLNPQKVHLLDNRDGRTTLDQIARVQGLHALADWIEQNRQTVPLPERERATMPREDVPEAIECPLNLDVLSCVARIGQYSLEEAASLGQVCSEFRRAMPNSLAGCVSHRVCSATDLIRLMAFDGSPLLDALGTLSFSFAEGELVGKDFGGYRGDRRQHLIELEEENRGIYPPAIDKRIFFRRLMAVLLLEFGAFLERNLSNMSNVHTIEILGGDREWDEFIITPLIRRALGSGNFPELRNLNLMRKTMGVLAKIPLSWHFASGLRNKKLEGLSLEGFIVSTPTGFEELLAWVNAGLLRDLRVLRLHLSHVSQSLVEDLRVLIEDGRLPCLEEFELDAEISIRSRSRGLLAALASERVQLRRLFLGPADYLEDFLNVGGEGGFQLLEELNVHRCRRFPAPVDRTPNLRDMLPSLRRIALSCDADALNWVRRALDCPDNADLFRLHGAERLCSDFLQGEELSEDMGFENRHFTNLRLLSRIPVADLQPTSSLARAVNQAREHIRFDCDYAYTDRDIHWLLWLYFGREVDLNDPHAPLLVGHTVLFPPLGFRQGNPTEGLERLLTRFSAGDYGQQTRLVLPLNHHDHWVGLVIDFNRGENTVNAYLLDTVLGRDDAFAQRLHETLGRAFAGVVIHFKEPVPVRHAGPLDCGPILVELLENAVTDPGTPVGFIALPQILRGLRRTHFRRLRDNGERLEETFQATLDRVGYMSLPALSVALMLSLSAVAQRNLQI